MSLWMDFWKLCGNPGMETLSSVQKLQIICGFMHAVHIKKLPKQWWILVAGGTTKYYLDNVTAAIASIIQSVTDKGYEGETWWCISKQVHGYKKLNLKSKQQRALPPYVYRYILQLLSNIYKSKFIAQLLVGDPFLLNEVIWIHTCKHQWKQPPYHYCTFVWHLILQTWYLTHTHLQ